MYKLYLSGVRFPVAPEKVTLKIKNKNTSMDLLSGGEMSSAKFPGLTEVSFDLLLPNVKYPFAIYENGFKNADYYLTLLELLKKQKKAFQYILIRKGQKKSLYNTNMTVTLEEYSIVDDTEEGTDVKVSVTLKLYNHVSTKVIRGAKRVSRKRSNTSSSGTSNGGGSGSQYTVKSGDTLWAIAKSKYGNGALYTKIYNANSSTIESAAKAHKKASSSNGHWIYPGTVLTIPA